MVCEFCGGPAEQLARTQREIWFGCHRCHRTWQEDAARQPTASPPRERVTSWLEPGQLSLTRQVLLVFASVALAFALRMGLKPVIGFASPFLVFTPAVMLAAYYGGTMPGAAATVLSALLGNHFFLQTLGEPGIERWDRIVLFLLVGALITWLMASSRSARAQLGASLWREQAARAEAEAANRAKDEFLALVSHELQTPASVILGWASIVRKQSLDGPALQRALDTIERNARLQSKLVADVLDTSRIITGALHLDRRIIDLWPVLAAAVEQMRPSADARHLRLEIESDEGACDVLGDSVRLQQVFANLLSNAIKFTPEGGRIEVKTAMTPNDVRISIADTGVGIDPEFLPRLFHRFEQDPATLAHSRSGLGLGLSIARHFVERHNGTIEVASAGRNCGTTFTVVLPREHRNAAWIEPTLTRLRPDALRAISVLVVEDDEDTRGMVTQVLERYGARVIVTGTAEGARDLAFRMKPDVMIADLRLPADDGVALVRSLRAAEDRQVAGIPAASMTASSRPEERDRALAAGFQVHLQKPIDPDELASIVAMLAGGPGTLGSVVH